MSNNEAYPTRWDHTDQTWSKRKYFAALLEESCARHDITVSWMDSEKWSGTIEASNGKAAAIYGYDLGLNSSAAAKVSDSKADTYELLLRKGVPALRHDRLTPHLTDGRKVGSAALTAMAIEAVGLPLVAKPDALASGGRGVTLCHDEFEVQKAIEEITRDGAPAAVSPYQDFTEYRAIVLDESVRGVIKKNKQPDGWMHNHSKGAEHTLVTPESELHAAIGALGLQAAVALDLRFTTVDIAARFQAEPRLAILEANDSVSIAYPQDPILEELAMATYGDAARLRLGVL